MALDTKTLENADGICQRQSCQMSWIRSSSPVRVSPHALEILNVGRGSIVDTDALVSALRNNAIAGAGLDVTDPEPLPADHPLWSFGNVTITPHNAGHSPKHWDRLADIGAGNVQRLDGGSEVDELENLVQSPQ